MRRGIVRCAPPVVHPLSPARLLWDAIVFVAALTATILGPLHAAFTLGAAGGGGIGRLWNDEAPRAIGLALLGVFGANAVVCARTATRRSGQLVWDPAEVARRYATSAQGALDALLIVALVLTPTHAACAFALCAALRHAINSTSRLEQVAEVPPSLARLLRLGLGLGCLMHWNACLWVVLANHPPARRGVDASGWWGGGGGAVNATDAAGGGEAGVGDADGAGVVCWSWWDLLRASMETRGEGDPLASDAEGGPAQVYSWALYLSATTISTVGFGDIVIANEREAWAMVAVLGAACALQGSLIATLGSIVMQFDTTWSRHQLKLDTMKAYMRHAKLSTEMRSRVLDYLDYCWGTSKGLDEAEVIATLPPTLQAEIRAATNQQLIQKVPLFDGCDEQTVEFIMRRLQMRVYLPSDMIQVAGEPGDEMMLINRGIVEIHIHSSDERGLRRKSAGLGGGSVFLSEGEYFGELSALVRGVATHDVSAYTHCQLYSLDDLTLEEVFRRNPRSITNLIATMTQYCEADALIQYIQRFQAANERSSER